MKITAFPWLVKALQDLCIDNDGSSNTLNYNAELPDDWLERAAKANTEISRMSDDERWELVAGEETEAEPIRKANPFADEFIVASFDDGPLAELLRPLELYTKRFEKK